MRNCAQGASAGTAAALPPPIRLASILATASLLFLTPSTVIAVCADRIVSGAEQCDDGGFCIGGPLAGTACASEIQCVSGGACFGGLDDLSECESDADCRMGACRRCRPVGGDGCAANCTLETDIALDLVDGEIEGTGDAIKFGTSGGVEFGPGLTIPFAISGSVRLTAGRTVDGATPLTVRAAGIELDRIPLSSIGCACVRLPSPSTCGGTLFDLGGTPSPDCTEGFAARAACPTDRPCAPLHGPGNAGSGFVGCGVPADDIGIQHDCNGVRGGQPRLPVTMVSLGEPGQSGKGNALLVMTPAIGLAVGRCSGDATDRGVDGEFCTADDPIATRGVPRSSKFTTGMASGIILNPGDFEDDVLGPFSTRGNAFTCREDGSLDVSNGIISTAFSACDQPTINDIIVPMSLAFAAAPPLPKPLPAPCPGDCDRLGEVTVDEVVRLVTVALGQGTVAQCPVGDRNDDRQITVDEILAAVRSVLLGCDSEPAEPVCGNGDVDGDEQCDGGGVCIGGPLAGMSCTSEPECLSGGACFGGLDDLRACESNGDCRGGACRRCRPVGGDGCAANCTTETTTTIELVAGVEDVQNSNHELFIAPGTSGVGLFTSLFYQALPLSGRVSVVTGGSIDGVTPLVVKSGGLEIGAFEFAIQCNCVRLPETSTCGGTAYELDGTPSLDCTAGFNGASTCPAARPCAPVHGRGNGGSGFIACGGAGSAFEIIRDCDNANIPASTRIFSDEPALADVGQSLITLSPAIGTGYCAPGSDSLGPDGEFCTEDDPLAARGSPSALPFVNGLATGESLSGSRRGPYSVEGAPFTCGADGSIDVSGGGIATTFIACDQFHDHHVSPLAMFFGAAREQREGAELTP